MKKRILGIVLLSTLLLSACTNEKDKESKTANSKVEQLESRVKELESSSSSEKIEKNKATEIVNAFKEEGLPVFDEQEADDNNLTGSNFKILSSSSFNYLEKNTAPDKLIANLITVDIAQDKENMEKIIENNETRNENISDDNTIWKVKYSKNEKINAVLTVGSEIPDEDFNKYKEVFESFK